MGFVYRICEAYQFEPIQWLVKCWGYHDCRFYGICETYNFEASGFHS
jgi:hypothetical protein